MKILKLLLLTTIIFGIYTYKEEIIYFLTTFNISNDELISNEYKKTDKISYISEFLEEKVTSRQDIIDAYYTILNNGYSNYNIVCDFYYEDCFDDFNEISSQPELLSHINNFVSPFNSFTTINTRSYNMSNIVIQPIKIYDEIMIEQINEKIDSIYNEIISEDMDDRTKILTFHDYIINTVSYDTIRADTGTSIYSSNTAYGPLFQGSAICSGYSDVMALFLDKIGLENYRIASDTHVWNYLFIEDNWYHLDLTWDDPITSTGENYLDHKYFLITTEELEKLDTTEHTYDKTIYIEAI